MGSRIKFGGQIYAGGVQHLVPTLLPQETVGYVIDFAFVGNVCRGTIFAVVLGEFLFCQPSHRWAPGVALKEWGDPASIRVSPMPTLGRWHEWAHEGRSLPPAYEVSRWPFTQELRKPGFVLDFFIQDGQG